MTSSLRHSLAGPVVGKTFLDALVQALGDASSY